MNNLEDALKLCRKPLWVSVVQLWFQTHNQHEIAHQLNIHQASVSRILRRCEIYAGRGRRDPVHDLPMDEVSTRYVAGESTCQLGEAYNVDPEVIRRRLDKHGTSRRGLVESRARGERNPQWKGGKESQDREYHKLARRIASLCLLQILPEDSVVHHMDENEKNNYPPNLWLFPNNSLHLHYHQQLLANQIQAASEDATLLALESGAQQLPLRLDLIGSLLDTSQHDPYGTRVLVENRLKEFGLLDGPLVRPRARQQQV